jgi:hypothetical protein
MLRSEKRDIIPYKAPRLGGVKVKTKYKKFRRIFAAENI